MADEKWIAGLRGDMPANEAARLALGARLGAVRDHLPAAVFHADADIEHVHQLRVCTRRAAAALRIFTPCLAARLAEKTRKTLRALRRSAGEARDWDVFLVELQTRLRKTAVANRPGLYFLAGQAHAHRELAQEHLRQAYHAKAELFNQCTDEIAQELGESEAEEPLHDLAGPTLVHLLQELENAARADLQSYDALHQVRILGKQLRYAMEIFANCYAVAFREKYYPAVTEMQDLLGLANDSHCAVERLKALRQLLLDRQAPHWPACQPGIDMLIAFHERRLPLQRRKFEKWWKAWLQSGAESAFGRLIGNKY
ncbi:MAG: CHAD domain-containing protein [Planctomycetes bacterium]|nr:CHAD domain-containing protein [Planctomycetota bacterium]